MPETPKLMDVARQAGVNVATASRALNRGKGWERLSDACVARVEQAAEELGYRPNRLARRLRTRRADAVGLLVPPLSSAFTRELVGGFESAIRKAGLHAVLVSGKDPVKTAIDFQAEGRIDGLLAPRFGVTEADVEALRSNSMPYVLTHVPPEADYGPAVALDAGRGIQRAVEYLAVAGHERLLWLGLERAGADNERRAKAFEQASQGYALPFEMALAGCGDGTLSGRISAACVAALPFLSADPRPDAVVCYHDPIALGVMMAARRARISIPQNLSVIGFDDSYGEVADPPLSSISPRPEVMAQKAMDMLLDILLHGGASEFHGAPIVVEPSLIVRNSTR